MLTNGCHFWFILTLTKASFFNDVIHQGNIRLCLVAIMTVFLWLIHLDKRHWFEDTFADFLVSRVIDGLNTLDKLAIFAVFGRAESDESGRFIVSRNPVVDSCVMCNAYKIWDVESIFSSNFLSSDSDKICIIKSVEEILSHDFVFKTHRAIWLEHSCKVVSMI